MLKFVFHFCHDHARDLPSFPTRRSSDLAYMEEASHFDGLVAMNAGRILATGTPESFYARTGTPTLEEAFIALLPDEKRDRKSTRRNSSHSEISYAVFCLKKKKIHRHTN